ncbi:hypothetical protein D3C75_1186260 [compost metagenome]
MIRQMRVAKEKGFEVIMFYVGLGDYRLNIERVAARVRNGGHHIDTADIIRRHQTSLDNLLLHQKLIDHLIVIDNSSSDGVIVLESDSETMKHHAALLPDWVKIIDSYLQNKNADQE